MTYSSGTRTLQSNSAEDLYGLISTQMGAHANYTFVEDVTYATYKWSVWKVGALNSTGVAFYVLFCRTVAASVNLYFALSEDYDTATHAVIRAAPPGNVTRTPAADGSVQGATSTVLPNAASVASFLGSRSLSLDASSYDYWIATNNDGMWIGSRVGAGTPTGLVLGTFDSLVDNPATNDPRPLILSGDSGSPAGIAPRHPLVTTSQASLWSFYDWFTSTYRWTPTAISGSVGGTANDLFVGQKAVGSRMVIRVYATPGINLAGYNRGLYRHLLWFTTAAGVAIGDTITIGSSTWTYTGKATGMFYETSAT